MALAIDQYRGDCLEGSVQLSEEPGGERPQVVLRPARPRRLVDTLRDMFLPQGYPGSVSDDYLEYQVWDTLQAFCSCITGALATRAVLHGMGVGDAEATPLAATVTWLLKDGSGMLGQIMFAWRWAAALDARCKQWRLLADVLNDAAICLEMVTPSLERQFFTAAMVATALAKSLVGVAGGATRAAIVQHQACRSNMADLSVKDNSQERVVGLAGLITTLLLLPRLQDGTAVCWLVYILLTLLHVFCNYRAVRAVTMATLNRPRMASVIDAFLRGGDADLSVRGVNQSECLVLGFSSEPALIGWRLNLGVSPFKLASVVSTSELHRVSGLYAGRPYLLVVDSPGRAVHACLRRGADATDELTAALAATVAVRVRQSGQFPRALEQALEDWTGGDSLLAAEYATKKLLPKLVQRLEAEGWNVKGSLLETGECRGVW